MSPDHHEHEQLDLMGIAQLAPPLSSQKAQELAAHGLPNLHSQKRAASQQQQTPMLPCIGLALLCHTPGQHPSRMYIAWERVHIHLARPSLAQDHLVLKNSNISQVSVSH
jgi:hypothetical protein